MSDSPSSTRREFFRQALSLVVVSAATPSLVLARLIPDVTESSTGALLATYSFRVADVSPALDVVGDSLKLQTPQTLWNLNPDHVLHHDYSLTPPRGRYPIAVTRVAETGEDAFKAVSTRCSHGEEYQIGDFNPTLGHFDCPHEHSLFYADGTKKDKKVPGGDLRKFPTTFDGDVITISNVNEIADVDADEVPTRIFLDQNWPNPFVAGTMIRYGLPSDATVRLTIHSTLGQHITTLFEGRAEAGVHRQPFDATGLPAGVYFYRLQTREFGTISRRMTVAR